MTALTAAKEAKRQSSDFAIYPVKGSTKVYKGGLVVSKDDGYAYPGVDGSGYEFLGVAAENGDNSASATDGAVEVRLYKTGIFQFTKASATQGDVGELAYIHDDQTVGISSTNSIACGYITDIVDSSTVKVRIDASVK